ncbi:MAG: tRNA 2-selenouridine(34) synthase MnmH [Spirochaetes bacterium]|nr:tRNA 2-selenouridine(34) synthase MnmH [Spirochaetota bacterium]
MNEISYEDALLLENPIFIDVRAPVEFTADHIPGAINIPLFDDAERAEIGTIYRHRGQYEAVVKGSSYAGAKLDGIVSRVRDITGKGSVIIHCFRGGMRSESLVSLLVSLGIPVRKLAGGYKSYRTYVSGALQRLVVRAPLFVLHGLTGTGKTQILKHIANSIDLEGMAGHRSSVFGGLGLEQNTQKMFESLLLARAGELAGAEFAVIEGESRKIGDLHIPPAVFSALTASPGILITASMETRVRLLLDEYVKCAGEGQVESIVKTLENRIGGKNVIILLELFRDDKLEEFAQFLLEKYYDPLYHHTLKKMEYIAVIDNSDSSVAAVEVESAVRRHLREGNSGSGIAGR